MRSELIQWTVESLFMWTMTRELIHLALFTWTVPGELITSWSDHCAGWINSFRTIHFKKWTVQSEYSLCTLWTRLEDSPQLGVSKASLKSDLKDVTLPVSDDDDCQRNIKNSYLSWRKEANNKLGGPLSFFFLLATGGQWKAVIFCITKTGGTNSIFNGTHLQNMCSKCLPNGYELRLEQNTFPTTIPNGTKSWRQNTV